MKLPLFLLDEWLERHESTTRFNLAASTGPSWRLEELLELMTEDEKDRLYRTPLTYCPGTGAESLREAIASMYGAEAKEIQIVTGASEALLSLFYLAAEPGANVVVSQPCFPPMATVPESLGLEVRRYTLRHEDGFNIDPEAVEHQVDRNTKLVLVNSPHNPTGTTVSEEALRHLDSFCSKRGVQLVVDEVYHPIYRNDAPRSAAELTEATVLGDFSKAFSLAGLRTGWVVERDPERRKQYWNARAHFSISNNFPGELLAEVAVRNRDVVFERARTVSETNLALLDGFFGENSDHLEWVRPAGGMTGFPRLVLAADARTFCEAAAARGVLLAPGDCFGVPNHFRLGFGACTERFDQALVGVSEALSEAMASSSHR
ncbi:MAG TPA: pyridoxal phosphate-dependent aminotransferase [Vicinamibacteria bacterium]|nr:pyridoxal phosphate-dependent aminotransferase [Vicinamibacteria bacterium]